MWYGGKGKKGFWACNPFETCGMQDFRDDREQICRGDEKEPQKKWFRRRGYVPTPSKRKMAEKHANAK